jgi:hypothetical protein
MRPPPLWNALWVRRFVDRRDISAGYASRRVGTAEGGVAAGPPLPRNALWVRGFVDRRDISAGYASRRVGTA